ncbi:unnamed protein product [Adineta steineri]|uniref:Apple domain-containing protein n=1 Tax=Adineta steineri TaxID=433720 RepID=A0A819MH64_9BILA|nr:unnamed protein product [Adineta steineri]CAF3978964.1 unnamed protein product [Adineta steineri]
MQSSIIAFMLIGIVIISQTNAKSFYNDDDFEEELAEALSSMRRGAVYKDLATSARCTEIVIGQDHNGGDIDASHTAVELSPAACAALCERYAACVAWTFNVNNGNCYTKSSITTISATSAGITGTCKKSSK